MYGTYDVNVKVVRDSTFTFITRGFSYIITILFTQVKPVKVYVRRRVKITRQVKSTFWLSHDVTTFQTSELLILLTLYFHGVLEQLKTNIQTNFHSEWVFGLVKDYA